MLSKINIKSRNKINLIGNITHLITINIGLKTLLITIGVIRFGIIILLKKGTLMMAGGIKRELGIGIKIIKGEGRKLIRIIVLLHLI